MARTLPWNTANLSNKAATTIKRPLKRLKSEPRPVKPEFEKFDHENDANEEQQHEPQLQQAQKRRTRNGRSPSTSPPPDPPNVEYMHEGLDGDDIYMMVEDEFQSVAQNFTAHLHHAEYKRLTRVAKEKKRSDVPEIPTEATFDTKHKLKRARLVEKQSSGLKSLMGGMKHDSDDEDTDTFYHEDKAKNPWAGTRLAGFLNPNINQKTSLKGLEKCVSGSRAAQGFGPNTQRAKERATERARNEDQTSSALVNLPPKMDKLPTKPNDQLSRLPLQDDSATKPKTKTLAEDFKVQPKKAAKWLDELDDFDEKRFADIQVVSRVFSSSSSSINQGGKR